MKNNKKGLVKLSLKRVIEDTEFTLEEVNDFQKIFTLKKLEILEKKFYEKLNKIKKCILSKRPTDKFKTSSLLVPISSEIFRCSQEHYVCENSSSHFKKFEFKERKKMEEYKKVYVYVLDIEKRFCPNCMYISRNIHSVRQHYKKQLLLFDI